MSTTATPPASSRLTTEAPGSRPVLVMQSNEQPVTFRAAVPVWPAGRERVMNDFVGFRAVLNTKPAGPVAVRLAASSIYRLTVNGQFAAHGPVRAAHGHFRVDEWDVTLLLREGANVIAVEVAGYNVDSYYTLDQTSFLQAEVIAGDTVLAATTIDGATFAAVDLPERLRKSERYSFQRAFSEVYRLRPDFDAWRRDPAAQMTPVQLAEQPAHPLHPRRIDKPAFDVVGAQKVVATGRLEKTPPPEPRKLWGLTSVGPQHKGYPEAKIESLPSIEVQAYRSTMVRVDEPVATGQDRSLAEHECIVYDLGSNVSGFIGATVTCRAPSRLVLSFDELLTPQNDVDHARLGCANLVDYELEPGTYRLETIEPYTLRYLKAGVWSGACEVGEVFVREYASPAGAGTASFASSDPRLDRIFAAAVHTYRQNAADLFMDCPSRERAGWLCDSFWTARVAFDLAGHALDEKNFLENFLLPETFAHIPPGMLPMCYPADHYNGSYIPQWAMWFVVELEEYFRRTQDRALVAALEPRVRALLKHLDGYLNADSLLEDLQGWRFIEWSKANDFVDGVNYPTNMLYAGALAAAGKLYEDDVLVARHEKMLETIRAQAFDGEFFVDQAMRAGGATTAPATRPAGVRGPLVRTANRTEVCQCYAFFFGAATPHRDPELWTRLTTEFGPHREQTKAYPEIHPANAFIGNYLRCALLARHGLNRQLAAEIAEYFLKMAELTGTLWENDDTRASCNHGFASHVAHWLYHDLLGAHVDPHARRLTLALSDCGLEHCEGTLAMGADGLGHIRWRVSGESIFYEAIVPEGWSVQVENRTRLEAVQRGGW